MTADEGKEMFKSEDVRDSSELQGKSGGYGYSTRVPLEGMPPGLYVLKVEARSRLGQGPTTNRQVQFRIVEPHQPGIQVNEVIAMSAVLLLGASAGGACRRCDRWKRALRAGWRSSAR